MFGRYVLVENIGRGAMGEVWVAIDPDLDRKVALKLLRRDRVERAEDRRRLMAEARAMARLTHPNVVTVHDVGEVDGQLFIAMEYVDGETLAAWLQRGPYPWQEALTIMLPAGAGLAAAHDVGLVHRDFKPANVMIGHDERPRVLDFGLARPEGIEHPASEDVPVALERDDSGRVLRVKSKPEVGARPPPRIQGTPHYMSAEQHRGDPIDARSDLFSFCVVLFEALYGARPFDGAHRLAIAMKITEGELLEIPVEERAPAWIHRALVRGLAPAPEDRFEDMAALLQVLDRSPKRRRRQRQRIAAGAAGLALAGAAFALIPAREDPCAAEPSTLDGAWGPEARAGLRARVDAAAAPGSRVGERLIAGLDAHEREWAEANRQLCRDREARRVTPRLEAARSRCLDERREALAALTGLANAEAVDPPLLDALAARPYAALRSLGTPSACVELSASPDGPPALETAELRARARARLVLILAPSDAESRLAAVLEGAGSRGDDPELELLLGRAAAATGDRDRAQLHLHAAARATTGERHLLAADAWLALVELELAELERSGASTPAEKRAHLREATRLLDYAEAVLDANEFTLGIELALLRGRVGLALDELDHATSSLDAGIERAAVEPLRAPDLLAALLELRAEVYEHRGSDRAAASDRARAEAVLREALGPGAHS
ncbi:Serine/threonine-protein kinase PrkC [Enhygromyxa salina]|uniref:Serine/threonine-protein kinase PrkC n=1 Tax=Enhygromyxa salina TaxID=215803 RepID=A0A2S9XDQ2_9BACT|nr:Serine/threonine-protein kinase PrkC [Enhygromyxa salina]